MGFVIKHESNHNLRVHQICLYDRVKFIDVNTRYVCIYDDLSIIPCNDIDANAPLIFEKTINPQVDPRTYVCIKVKDQQRNPLAINIVSLEERAM